MPRIDDERQEELYAMAKATPTVPPRAPSTKKQFPILPVALGALAVVGIVAVLAWPKGELEASAPPTAPPVTVEPSATPLPATATPSYPDITADVETILAHMKEGRWKEAATVAEGALNKPGLRAEDHQLLTRYAVTNGLKSLYLEPFRPLDRDQHQTMVNTYLGLKERARGANVEIEAPLVVASEAFTRSQFQLSRIAFEEALRDGSFEPAVERDITANFVSTLFGLGKWYTTAEQGSPLYEEGLRYLAASHAVAVKYETGQGDAAMLLTKLVSANEEEWPAPAATPLLR